MTKTSGARTVISRRWSPAGVDRFSDWKTNDDEWRPDGAPPVWGVPYQWGAMTTLALGPLSLRLAGMNSAPSSEPFRGSGTHQLATVSFGDDGLCKTGFESNTECFEDPLSPLDRDAVVFVALVA